jgi:alkylation response protein AidB-like acyl-CoA dehydrogenase
MTDSNKTPAIQAIRDLFPGFRTAAPDYDREGRFVHENYAALRSSSFFSLLVPNELGGGGCSHSDVAELLREMGQYCASTALAASMHTHLVAATVFRHLRGQPGEALLRRIATEQLVLVSTGAGDWVDSVGRAERVPGGYRVSGRKRFCSGSPAGDLLVTSAPWLEAEAGDEVLHFALSLKAEGVTIREDWDALGMRGTGSHSIELDGVLIPEAAVTLRRPRGHWHPVWDVVVGAAVPLFMAPYVGIAERAAALALESANARRSQALHYDNFGRMSQSLTLTQIAFREMLASAKGLAFEPKPDLSSHILTLKTLVARSSQETVERATAIVGGSSFFRNSELERLARDVRASAFHALPEREQLEFSGRVALGQTPISVEPTRVSSGQAPLLLAV